MTTVLTTVDSSTPLSGIGVCMPFRKPSIRSVAWRCISCSTWLYVFMVRLICERPSISMTRALAQVVEPPVRNRRPPEHPVEVVRHRPAVQRQPVHGAEHQLVRPCHWAAAARALLALRVLVACERVADELRDRHRATAPRALGLPAERRRGTAWMYWTRRGDRPPSSLSEQPPTCQGLQSISNLRWPAGSATGVGGAARPRVRSVRERREPPGAVRAPARRLDAPALEASAGLNLGRCVLVTIQGYRAHASGRRRVRDCRAAHRDRRGNDGALACQANAAGVTIKLRGGCVR